MEEADRDTLIVSVRCSCGEELHMPWIKFFAQLQKLGQFGICSSLICKCGNVPLMEIREPE